MLHSLIALQHSLKVRQNAPPVSRNGPTVPTNEPSVRRNGTSAPQPGLTVLRHQPSVLRHDPPVSRTNDSFPNARGPFPSTAQTVRSTKAGSTARMNCSFAPTARNHPRWIRWSDARTLARSRKNGQGESWCYLITYLNTRKRMYRNGAAAANSAK
jgi:hypothetical protein